MSHEERTGTRSLLYSGWHRTASTARFIGRGAAAKLSMIDVDACEYCCYCLEPVALIETQESNGPPKPAPVTARLARMAGIPAYSVSVQVDRTVQLHEVAGFRVQRITQPGTGWVQMSCAEYARWLVSLRAAHACAAAVVVAS